MGKAVYFHGVETVAVLGIVYGEYHSTGHYFYCSCSVSDKFHLCYRIALVVSRPQL